MLRTTLITLIASLILSACSKNSDCLVTRAAFDIGSGSTKVKVAKVNKCLNKIEEVLLENSMPVAYKDDLKYTQSFSKFIQERGLLTILKLKEDVQKFSPEKIYASATSAFRQAKNAKTFVSELKKLTGVDIVIISQETEAKLGYYACSQKVAKKPHDLIVWDIGGGSMQITTTDLQGKYQTYLGKTASVGFKNIIISKIQEKDIEKIKSPNPLSRLDASNAVGLATEIAISDVSKNIKQKLKRKDVLLVGIGGVHNFSIAKNIKTSNNFYTMTELQSTLDKKIGKTDKMIGGKYAATDVSNLALVLGFMKGLDIEKIQVEKINMADGILLNPALLQPID